jgi:hypothetical protein
MEFNGQIWFWIKVCVLLFYFLALLLKAWFQHVAVC